MVSINENAKGNFVLETSYSKVDPTKKQALIELVMNDGESIKEASLSLGIKYANARKIIMKAQRAFENADINSDTAKRGAPAKVNSKIIISLEKIIKENNRYTLKKIKELLYEREGVTLSISTINSILKKFNNECRAHLSLHS